MEPDLFEQLLTGLREAIAVERGELAPARVTRVARLPYGSIERIEIDPEEYRLQAVRDAQSPQVRDAQSPQA